MSSTLGHGFNTVKGNLTLEERTAVADDAKNLFGPKEVVLYGFRTEGVRIDDKIWEGDIGKVLFTTHRIVFYNESRNRGQCANIYPYSALVSMTFPCSRSPGRTFDALPCLKFREVDCNEHPRGGLHKWIFVRMTSPTDLRHLSAATLCMDRVPSK
jgi:hypothetical protein